VRRLRNYRDSVGAPASARIPARLVGNGYEGALETIGRLARFDIASAGSDGQPVDTVALDGATVEVLATDTVDTAGAQVRLEQQRSRLVAEIERARGKLGNEGFTAKAPPELVQAERDKLERFEAELAELEG
jgi:valyl-tRNA synthetase